MSGQRVQVEARFFVDDLAGGVLNFPPVVIEDGPVPPVVVEEVAA